MVHDGDRYAAFSHGCSHALYRSGADIANGEDARGARFEGERLAIELPLSRLIASGPVKTKPCSSRAISEGARRPRQLVKAGSFVSTDASASVASERDAPVNDVEDSDTSKRADFGCSSATGGRGEVGHPAENPRCAPGDHFHGAIRAAHRGPRPGSWH